MSGDDFILRGPPVGKIPDCSLGEFLVPKIRSLPQDKIIHVEANTGATQTVGEFLTASVRLSEGLKKLGLKENDVVGMFCRNSLEVNDIMLGTWLCGAAVAPMPGTMTVGEMKHNMEIVRPKFIFSEKESLNNVKAALELLSMSPKIILVGSEKNSSEGHVTFQEVLAEVDVAKYKPQSVKSPSTQLVAIFFSSGTSGLPKAVGITHKCLVLQSIKLESLVIIDPQMTILQVSQFFWVTATLLLLCTILTGQKRVMIKEVTIPNVFKAIQQHKVQTTFIAPSFALSLCTSPDFDKYDMSSMKIILLGGSPFTPNMGEKLKEKWKGVSFIQSYGTTEIAGSITGFYGDEDPFSVGKAAPGVEIKIADTITGKPLKSNSLGEILVKTPELMIGYLKNEEATREVLDEEGWFHTGDLGYYDDSGQIYLADRLKEMIKVMNMQVSPTEVENVILCLPGVAEVCVAGVTRDGSSQEVLAFVVKKENSNVTKEDILAYVSKSLSDYKRPTGGIYFVDSLPKTQSGKIQRRAVRELAQKMFSKQ